MNNYFKTFDIPVEFDLDKSDLESRYLGLQKALHPDNFANASSNERLAAVNNIAQINAGYKVLKSPIERAEHIAQLNGVKVSEEHARIVDAEFLIQQMQWREELELIKSPACAVIAEDKFELLEQEVVESRNDMLLSLQSVLKSDEPNRFKKSYEIVKKLRFIEKMLEELSSVEEQFDFD